MQRVLVIGSPGAGKSRLATLLAERTGLPLFHLDQLHWRPGWVECEPAEFDSALREIIAGQRWIVDGNYGRTLAMRLARADTVIHLDLPAWRCAAHAIGRIARSRGKVRPDMAPGCPERFDLSFLAYIISFPRHGGRRIAEKLRDFPGKVIRLRSRADIAHFLAALPPTA